MKLVLKKMLLRIITVFTLLLGIWNISFAFDNRDFQYWNTETVSWKINDLVSAKAETEFRFGDNGGNFYYQHTDLGFTYSGIAEWLDLGINYRQIYEKKNGRWQYENVPHLNATLKTKLLNYPIGNRSRFEYKAKEDAEDYWRYRNKTTIKTPFKLTTLEIQPYIADEIFYDYNLGLLNRNRLYGGFAFRIFKDLKGDIFYLWQASKKSGTWTDTNVAGTKLTLSF